MLPSLLGVGGLGLFLPPLLGALTALLGALNADDDNDGDDDEDEASEEEKEEEEKEEEEEEEIGAGT